MLTREQRQRVARYAQAHHNHTERTYDVHVTRVVDDRPRISARLRGVHRREAMLERSQRRRGC